MQQGGQGISESFGADEADAESSDVRDAILAALERRGSARGLRARIRAEVFATLSDQQSSPGVSLSQPEVEGDMYLCMELIRDFLARCQLDASLSVFEEEAGLGVAGPASGRGIAPIDRRLLAREVGISTVGFDDEVPMLLLLLQALKGGSRGVVVSSSNSR
jgi:hypothetical protein